MKKFIMILMAIMLVLVNVAALAEDPEIPDPNIGGVVNEAPARAAGAAPEYSIKKTYETTGTATNVYPKETLKFTVTPKESNYPVITVGSDNTFAVDGSTSEYTIPVTVPGADAYKTLGAGRYHYTVKEVAPDDPSQAVEYDITTTFNVDVYAYYDENGEFVREPVIYSGEEKTSNITTKIDQYKNKYEVGELEVAKVISGNLADPTREFSITITLNATNTVANDISVAVNDSEKATVDATSITKGWKGSKTVTLTAKGGGSVKISNIPTGVTYTIVENEDTYHIKADEDQMDYVNDLTAYAVSGEIDGVNVEAKAIGKSPVKETITNTKEITVPTGIALDTVPYILILAVALFGLVKMGLRKREEY